MWYGIYIPVRLYHNKVPTCNIVFVLFAVNFMSRLTKGRVAKCIKRPIESVGATIRRPRADNIRPYIRRM